MINKNTITDLGDYFQTIAKNHTEVKQFNKGEVYEFSIKGSEAYPNIFLEYPVSVRNVGVNQEEIGFAIIVGGEINYDNNLDTQHTKYDIAITILDDVIATLDNDDTYQLVNYNYITIDEFSDDNVAGVRCEFTINKVKGYNKCTNLNYC